MEQQLKNIGIVIGAVIITAVVVGGGVYFWQKENSQRLKADFEQISDLNKQNDDLKKKIIELENQKSNVEAEKKELERKNCKGTWENDTCIAPKYGLHLISPNGGEKLCLGKDYTIRWESQGLRTVGIQIKTTVDAFMPLTNQLPPDFNESGKAGRGEFLWKVGKTHSGYILPEGYTYEILISGRTGTSVDSNNPVSDRSDSIFSIINCQG